MKELCHAKKHSKKLFDLQMKILQRGDFLKGGNEGIFALWSLSLHVGVQIGRELVRLITLISLNKFLIKIASPMSLKKFSRTTFR